MIDLDLLLAKRNVYGLDRFLYFLSFFLDNRKQATKVNTAQKMKFSIKDFFSKCDQTHKKLRIWSHLLKKSLIENFFFVQWNSTWSDFDKIPTAVPQGSTVDQLLFNIYICGLFYGINDLDITSFADDNTPYI